MNCREVQTLIQEFLDGELDSAQAEEVRSHLADCGNCRAEADELDRVIKAMSNLPRVSAPDGFAETVMARNRDAGPSTEDKIIPMRPSAFLARIIGIAATLVVAVILVFILARAPWRHDMVAVEEEPPESLSIEPTAGTELEKNKSLDRDVPRFKGKRFGKAAYQSFRNAGGIAPGDALKVDSETALKLNQNAQTAYRITEQMNRQNEEERAGQFVGKIDLLKDKDKNDIQKGYASGMDGLVDRKSSAKKQGPVPVTSLQTGGGAAKQAGEKLPGTAGGAQPGEPAPGDAYTQGKPPRPVHSAGRRAPGADSGSISPEKPAVPHSPPSGRPTEYARRDEPRKPEREPEKEENLEEPAGSPVSEGGEATGGQLRGARPAKETLKKAKKAPSTHADPAATSGGNELKKKVGRLAKSGEDDYDYEPETDSAGQQQDKTKEKDFAGLKEGEKSELEGFEPGEKKLDDERETTAKLEDFADESELAEEVDEEEIDEVERERTEEKLVFRGADVAKVRLLLAELSREIPDMVLVTGGGETRSGKTRSKPGAAPAEEDDPEKTEEKQKLAGDVRARKSASRSLETEDIPEAAPETYILNVDDESFQKILARLKTVTEKEKIAGKEAPAPEPPEESGTGISKRPAQKSADDAGEEAWGDKSAELVVIIRVRDITAGKPPVEASKEADKTESK